jgi:hypothetical protein
MRKELTALEGTQLWDHFEKQCLQKPGTHILSLGQTGTGKTIKGYRINKWLIDRGETLGVLDCGKPGEILPYASFGLPLNLITPVGCEVIIENSPVQVHQTYSETPELSWHFAKKGMINIFTFREFILDDLTSGEYTSRFMRVLLDQVMRNKLTIPLPFTIDVDEAADVIPAYGLIENKYQKEAAARFSKVLKKIRYKGIRVHAKDQAWGDLYPNARRQFPFLILSRSPGTQAKTDIGVVKNYSFETLAVNEAKIIFPQKNWFGTWVFPDLKAPKEMTIEYEGEVYYARSRRKKEEEKFEHAEPTARMIQNEAKA